MQLVGHVPYPVWPRTVGQDPGAQWTQEGGKSAAKKAQEAAQGYTSTQLMTLQMQVAELVGRVDALVLQMDPSTDAASKQYLLSLQSSCHALAEGVGQLAKGVPGYSYALLAGNYQALANQFEALGVEEASTEPAPVAAAPKASAPAPAKSPGTEKSSAEPKPTIKTQPSGMPAWGIGAALLAVLGVGYYFLK